MKEFIKINYKIEIKKIYDSYFYYQNEKIKIIVKNEYIKDINNYIKAINIINDKRISQFVLNKNNEIMTKYKDKYIILLKLNDIDENINLEYLKIFNKNINNINEINIIDEWTKQIDLNEIEMKEQYKDYYIGLAEIALSMLKNNQGNELKVIGHNIKFENISKEELNNPLNFVIVDNIYSLANYIKYKYFIKKINYNEIEIIIKDLKNEHEKNRFLSYMIYPNYYFESKNKEKIVKKHKEYEKMIIFLKEIIKK